MNKLSVVFLIIFFLLTNISALKITEIEMNPLEGKDGIEWIELYNDENSDIDISGWKIWEGVYGSSGPKIIETMPNGTIIQKKGFYIVEWSTTKLNNAGDFVILYDSNGTKIDETEMLDESESGVKTWQLCDSWEFKLSTKGEENSCEEAEEPVEEAEEDKETTKEEKEEINEELPEIEELQVEKLPSRETEPIELQTINLNPTLHENTL